MDFGVDVDRCISFEPWLIMDSIFSAQHSASAIEVLTDKLWTDMEHDFENSFIPYGPSVAGHSSTWLVSHTVAVVKR